MFPLFPKKSHPENLGEYGRVYRNVSSPIMKSA